MNAAGARPSGDQAFDLGHRLTRVANGVGATELTAEAVRRFHGVHPIRPGGKRIRVVGDRRGDGVGGIRPPVVSLAHRDDVASTGGRHRQPQRQIACLRTGIHQEHGVQRIGQRGRQSLAELDHRLVVEARVRVQLVQLAGRGFGHPRVRVTQNRDVVDHVEVGPAGRGHQEVPPAAFDLGWPGVVVLLYPREALVAPRQQLIGRVRIGQGRAGRAPGAGRGSVPASPSTVQPRPAAARVVHRRAAR